MKLFCERCGDTEEVDYPNLVCGRNTIHPSEDENGVYWACVRCESIIVEPHGPGVPLIVLPFDQARAEKFKIGRAEHGPVFRRNPIEEIDLELIDAVNYAEEAIRQGFDREALETIIARLKEVDAMVRTLYTAP